MTLDILNIQPHQVSRDLRGYSVLFYGEIKSGKTTTASKFPKPLLVAFEVGYNALPGVRPAKVNNWSDFLNVMRQLNTKEAKEMYETIIIDTADIAYEYVEDYICQREGVSSIPDIPFGKGYGEAKKEFDVRLRQITQMGYGLVIISHAKDKTFTDAKGGEYNQIVPTLGNQASLVVSRMCDIVGYARPVTDEKNGGNKTKLFMRGTSRFVAGSRFKYIPESIDFNYENLVNAIGDAIDKESLENGGEFVTEQRTQTGIETVDYDFDDLMKRFQTITSEFV